MKIPKVHLPKLPEPSWSKSHRRFMPRRCLATLPSQILPTNRALLPTAHLFMAPKTALADTAPAKSGLRSHNPQNPVPKTPKS
jgi:hypothetical protein